MRKPVVKFLAGSHNRNLNTASSDKDYKIFVLPTFTDLYESKVFTHHEVTPTVDEDIQDVRRLEKLLGNCNLTYLELLFSNEIQTYGYKEFDEILSMREDIARINLKALFRSSIGMYDGQMKNLTNPTSDVTKEIIERHGYNTKKAMMALHFLKFLIRYHKNGFTNCKEAIWYEDAERDFMLSIKAGKMSREDFIAIADSTLNHANLLKEDYINQEFNSNTFAEFQKLLRQMTLKHIKTL